MVTIDLKPKDFREVWELLEELAEVNYEEGMFKEGDELLRLAMKFQVAAGYQDSSVLMRRREIQEPPFHPKPISVCEEVAVSSSLG